MAVTIRDVAKAAGTSISTVYKVINRHYSISEATAARVRQVIEELNYRPMASAQSFASGMTRKVALSTALQRKVSHEASFCKAAASAALPMVIISTGRRLFGGGGGIRTLETLLTSTRFPVARPRPS